MADIELWASNAFEAHLDMMVNQLSEGSTELIIERPRYAHAVMVFANGNEPGELLTASRIKILDPIYVPVEASTNGHPVCHQYSDAMEIYDDDDIQKALRKLEESRNILDEPLTQCPTISATTN